jgi:hypothetical protein
MKIIKRKASIGVMRGRNEVGQPPIGCGGSIRLGVEVGRKIRLETEKVT